MAITMESKRQYFDGIAAQWDSFPAPPDAPERQAEFVRLATEHNPSRILDVGCGTGVLLPSICRHCSSAAIVELDFSRQMLEANRAKHGDQAEYCCSELTAVPYPAGSFDAVLCFNVLPHLDIDAALRACGSLLSSGGRLAIGHLMGSAELNAFHASMQGPVAHDHLPASGELAKLLRATGLAVLRCEERADWYFVLAEKK